MKALLLLIIVMCTGCSERINEHTVTGTVISIGACGGNEGFFSGPYECSLKVDVNGNTQYWEVWGKVVIGQPVYKPCWEKEDGALWCSNASTKK